MKSFKICNLHFWVTLVIFTCYSFISFLFYKTCRSCSQGDTPRDVILQSYTFYAVLVVTGILIMAKDMGIRINCSTYILYSNIANIAWTYSIIFDINIATDEIFSSFLTYSMLNSIISIVFVIIYQILCRDPGTDLKF